MANMRPKTLPTESQPARPARRPNPPAFKIVRRENFIMRSASHRVLPMSNGPVPGGNWRSALGLDAVVSTALLAEPEPHQFGPVLHGLVDVIPGVEGVRIETLAADPAVRGGGQDFAAFRVEEPGLRADLAHEKRLAGAGILQDGADRQH